MLSVIYRMNVTTLNTHRNGSFSSCNISYKLSTKVFISLTLVTVEHVAHQRSIFCLNIEEKYFKVFYETDFQLFSFSSLNNPPYLHTYKFYPLPIPSKFLRFFQSKKRYLKNSIGYAYFTSNCQYKTKRC